MPSKEEISDRLDAILEETDNPIGDEVEELNGDEQATATAESNPEARNSSREYIVLIGDKNGSNWAVASTAQSTSAEGAIRSLGEELEDGATYVAVPKRNWNPVPVSIKTTTTISFA